MARRHGPRPTTGVMASAVVLAIGGRPASVAASALVLPVFMSPVAAAEPGVLVVELDGGEVAAGPDDAVARTTPIAELVGSFAPFGGDVERREALLQAVRADWLDYDVAVLSTPPAQGGYAMVMVGPTNPFGPHVTGIATLDCDDAGSARSLAFAFYAAENDVTATAIATTISQEAAHGLGLEHVDDPADIMLPVQGEGDASFTDECLPLAGPAECPDQHAAECGSGALQNAHAELLRRFGPREPDTRPPSVAIAFPADGAELSTRDLLTVAVEATDDHALAEATLHVNGEPASIDPDVPYGWELAELPPGEHELYVTATDLGGNVGTSEPITIVVRPGGSAPADDCDDETPPATVPAPPPLPAPPTTTACAVGHGPAPWALLLLVPLVAARRPPRRPGRSR